MIKLLADKIFRRASSTYYYASSFFPPSEKEKIFTLYAYVRTTDDFVDMLPINKPAFMAVKNQTNQAFLHKKIPNQIISDFVNLAETVQIKKEWIDSFLAAMEADLHKKTYTSLRELEDYIYGSAEVIGLMMAQILQLPSASYPTARFQGKAMQLVNMIRDVKEDTQLGRQYLPGLPQLPLESSTTRTEFIMKINEYLKIYKSWQDEAKSGWKYLPLRSRIAVHTAASMYEWTAKQIARDPLQVLHTKIKPKARHVLISGMGICIKEIISISRPRFWLYLAGPFGVGWAASTTGLPTFFHPTFWLSWLYFFVPANMFLYAINDLADHDTDKYNSKKGEQETSMNLSDRRIYTFFILISFLAVFILPFPNLLSQMSIAAFLVLSVWYSLPPLRLKSRPILDMVSNTLYILPGIYAYSLHSSSFPNTALLLAAAIWTWAMQLFSALPDIVPDTKAKIATTAVTFGESKSLWLCTVLWIVAGCLAATQHLSFLLLSLYAVLPLAILAKKVTSTRLYWRFPLINALVGSSIFVYALLT